MKIKREIKYWIQRRTRGWSDDECWNIDWQFIKWINSHFKVYRKQASKFIDLSFHKFKYKHKEYNQLQLIDKIIEISNKLVNEDDYWGDKYKPKELENMKDEIFDIFKLIFWTMHW